MPLNAVMHVRGALYLLVITNANATPGSPLPTHARSHPLAANPGKREAAWDIEAPGIGTPFKYACPSATQDFEASRETFVLASLLRFRNRRSDG